MSGSMRRPLRLGMVGGGFGAFIGGVHRIAARIDGHYELVAGAFDVDPAKGKAFAESIGIASDRAYGTFREMAAGEAARSDRIDLVSIVVPNFLHAAAATAFLEAGINVMCEKPLAVSLAEAERLRETVRASGRVFCLAHVYSGYPLVRHAREMVGGGVLGSIRVVQVEYPQDWLATAVEQTGNAQAAWRTDPAQGGQGGCLGDVGTHAVHLAEFVTGLKVSEVCADLSAFVPGRQVSDNANVMLRFTGGARGALWASQVATGTGNALRLRVFGTKGSIEWAQEEPNSLWYAPLGEPKRAIVRGAAGPQAGRVSRIPAGHPEGYLEAFANLYAETARAIEADLFKERRDDAIQYPTVDDGVTGMAFVEACLGSARAGGAWAKI